MRFSLIGYGLLLVLTVVVIVLAIVVVPTDNLPKEVDVIIVASRTPNGLVPTPGRHRVVLWHVLKYMPWVKTIWMVGTSEPDESISSEELPGDGEIRWLDFAAVGYTPPPITFPFDFQSIPHEDAANVIVSELSRQKRISEYFIYLGDYCWPVRKIKKNYLFSLNNPRVWNTLRSPEDTSFWGTYLTNTAPSLVGSSELLEKTTREDGFKQFLIKEFISRSAVLRRDLSRDVILNLTLNPEYAAGPLPSKFPRAVFITVHMTGKSQGDLDVLLENLLKTFPHL